MLADRARSAPGVIVSRAPCGTCRSRCRATSLTTSSGSWSGTIRQVIFARASLGTIVLPPGPWNPPHIPLTSTVGRVHWRRSEEHTSELQSLAYLVCRLLLEKKKNYDRPTKTLHYD